MDPLLPTSDFLIYESSVIIPILEMNKFNIGFEICLRLQTKLFMYFSERDSWLVFTLLQNILPLNQDVVVGFYCYLFSVLTGSHYGALAVLEPPKQTRLALNLQKPASASSVLRIKGICTRPGQDLVLHPKLS